MLYQVPFGNEALYLMQIFYDKKGHVEYRRVIKEIQELKYHWKGIGNDFLKYVKEYPFWIRNKAGTPLKPTSKKITPKDPQERYVCDNWKLSKDLQEISGYEWVIEIIN